VQQLLQVRAKKYQAKLYKVSVNSNHIHVLIRFLSPTSQSQFLRDVEATGRWVYTPRPPSELVKTLDRLEKRFRDAS